VNAADLPAGHLTAVLIARQQLPCINQQCAGPIHPGDPMVLLDAGWSHALHLEETP
jgi:hypothetical protein